MTARRFDGRRRRTRALGLTWRAAWLEAWSNQRGFWSQILLMCVNNAVFVVFWVVFFQEVETLQGWDIDRVLLLVAVLTTVAGVVIGLLHNVRRLGYLAADGGLDAALSLPVPTLAHLALRRVEPVSVGDLLFGVALFLGFGSPTPMRLLIFIFGVATATAVLVGFFMMIGSLSFFVGRSDSSDVGLQSVLLFAHYPIDIYSGVARLFLYVIMPAGFISAVPAKLIEEFDPMWAALAALAAAVFLGLGRQAFVTGLRRYTSGAVWTDA
jgi:ABC-2 type transport system permease protein